MIPYQELLIWLYSLTMAGAILITTALLWYNIIRLAQVIWREFKQILRGDKL